MIIKHELAGFGFGPIQSGIFAAEAAQSSDFNRISIAEVDGELVDAVRKNGNTYSLNIAHRDCIKTVNIKNVDLFNITIAAQRDEMIHRLKTATEIVTSLPSVNFFNAGGENSPAALIALGLQSNNEEPALIYAAENNNQAAELLEKQVAKYLENASNRRPSQFLNTVIGKMSQVIDDPNLMKKLALAPVTPDVSKAFLVEEFNRILVSSANINGFTPGFSMFEEKNDLAPFEETKLFGHNAVHAMLGFFAKNRGLKTMTQLREHPDLMQTARSALVNETGQALIKLYKNTGENLFTPKGFKEYADDLLERITNPMLHDAVDRMVRDPIRKLGYNDRLFGAVRLCLDCGIKPVNLVWGVIEGLKYIQRSGVFEKYSTGMDKKIPEAGVFDPQFTGKLLSEIWQNEKFNALKLNEIANLVSEVYTNG